MAPKTPTKECPWCHKPKTNISEHKEVCRARPTGADLAGKGQEPRKRRSKPNRVDSKKQSERPIENGCQACGLNVAERELVAEGIRAGMSFDNAIGFVRHAQKVWGK